MTFSETSQQIVKNFTYDNKSNNTEIDCLLRPYQMLGLMLSVLNILEHFVFTTTLCENYDLCPCLPDGKKKTKNKKKPETMRDEACSPRSHLVPYYCDPSIQNSHDFSVAHVKDFL